MGVIQHSLFDQQPKTLTVFELPPRTRNTDPPTSRVAERKMLRQQALANHYRIILSVLNAADGQGLTVHAIAQRSGELTQYQVWRRLKELMMNNLLHRKQDADGKPLSDGRFLLHFAGPNPEGPYEDQSAVE